MKRIMCYNQEWKVGLILQSQYTLLYQQDRGKPDVISMELSEVFYKIELSFLYIKKMQNKKSLIKIGKEGNIIKLMKEIYQKPYS